MSSTLGKGLILLAEEGNVWQRIFGLDAQTLFDTCITLIAMLVLFILLSYLLFNPARNLIKKRQELIAQEMSDAKIEKEQALAYKDEYDRKLKGINEEADEIISIARKKAKKQENEIVDEAKEEAVRIKKRAARDIELEKSKAKDQMKQEIITVASAMAEKLVASSIDEAGQNELFETTLKEMGEETWQN